MSIQKYLDKYEAGMQEVVHKLEILNKDYERKNNYILMEHIKYRLKSKESIKQKLLGDGFDYCEEDLNKINDIAGVRVVVAFEKDIDIVKELIMSIPNIILIKEKDYIQNPKKNGYESYHMIIKIPVTLLDGTEFITVEIQIRTLLMDVWASVHHKLVYKNEDKSLERVFIDYSNKMMDLDEEINNLKK